MFCLFWDFLHQTNLHVHVYVHVHSSELLTLHTHTRTHQLGVPRFDDKLRRIYSFIKARSTFSTECRLHAHQDNPPRIPQTIPGIEIENINTAEIGVRSRTKIRW